jgi:hypothetical protein
MEIEMQSVVDCLRGARQLLAKGFCPHFTKAVERVGGEVRHVVYAGPKFHREIYEWAPDDALYEGAGRNGDVALAVEEFLRPMTAPVFSIMQYSRKEGVTKAHVLAVFDAAIARAQAKLKAGSLTYKVE